MNLQSVSSSDAKTLGTTGSGALIASAVAGAAICVAAFEGSKI